MRRFLLQAERLLTETVPAALLLAMIAVTGLQVVLRFGFNKPLPWPEEMARLLFTWMAYLGAALAYRRGSHIRLTILLDRLGPRMRAWAEAAIHLLSASFFTVTLVGLQTLLDQVQGTKSTAVGYPMVLNYLSLLVGGSLIILQGAVQAVAALLPRPALPAGTSAEGEATAG